jgi:hypothetical protein
MLLPGYITVILGLVIYYPTFPFFSPSSNLSIDIFSVVVFVVAGPALGFIQWQIYFHLSSLARFDSHTFNIKYEFQRAYSSLRLVCSPEEREELNLMDGRYIFGFSTAIGLGFVSVYALVVLFATPGIAPCLKLVFDEHSVLCKDDDLQGAFLIGALILVSIILAVGSYFDNKRSRLIVICKLIEKYKASGDLQINTPSTCKRRFRKIDQIQKGLPTSELKSSCFLLS